jgi:hypothetical protein
MPLPRPESALAASHEPGKGQIGKGLQLAMSGKSSLGHGRNNIPTTSVTAHYTPAHTRFTMFAAARTLSPVTRCAAGRRLFHASAPAWVKVGDKLPSVDLVEGSPGNKVNLASELTGKGLIIGTCRVNDTRSWDPFLTVSTLCRCPGGFLALVF